MRESTFPYWSVGALYRLPAVVWRKPDAAFGSPQFYEEFWKRYGLRPRPTADYVGGLEDKVPLGLVITEKDIRKSEPGQPPEANRGLTVSCEVCHTSFLFGERVVGLSNPFANGRRLYQDLSIADGDAEGNVGGLYEMNPANASMVNGADHIGVIGLYFHNPDLSINPIAGMGVVNHRAWQTIQKTLAKTAYIKTPPWFLFKTKQEASTTTTSRLRGFGFYADGGLSKDSVFADFSYMVAFSMSFWESGGSDLRRAREAWAGAAPKTLMTLEGPLYPFDVAVPEAKAGADVYRRECRECHGDYDVSSWASVKAGNRLPRPQLAYDLTVDRLVGTDEMRLGFSEAIRSDVNRVLAGRSGRRTEMIRTGGYLAPPLTSIYARFPYLHNASVPDLRTLLENSSSRPRSWRFTGNPAALGDYDRERLGLRWERVGQPGDAPPGPFDRVYFTDPTKGLGPQGHDYGTRLPTREKRQLIEFLKTI